MKRSTLRLKVRVRQIWRPDRDIISLDPFGRVGFLVQTTTALQNHVQAFHLAHFCFIFIAPQHIDSNSVRLSVRPPRSGILWKRFNKLSQFLHCTVAQSFQFYEYQISSRNSDGVTPCAGAKYRWGLKFRDFRPITRCSLQTIQDSAIQYYRRRIGNRTQAFEWYQFQ